jgi:hypothetical protein
VIKPSKPFFSYIEQDVFGIHGGCISPRNQLGYAKQMKGHCVGVP